MVEYIPDQGDVVKLDMQSDEGGFHEESAVVLSARNVNEQAGTVLLCPVTDTLTSFSAQRIKRLNFRCHRTRYVAKAPEPLMRAVTRQMVLMLS